MVRENLKFETQGEKHEGKTKVVSQIKQGEKTIIACIKKVILWSYYIGF